MSEYFEEQTFDSSSFPDLKNSSTEFVECSFKGIDMSAVNFSRTKFLDCTFHDCNFSNSLLKNAHFRSSTFKKCKLIGLNWAEASSIANPSFYESVMDYCVFQGMSLKGAVFNDCRLHEADFYEANLTKALFNHSHLKGATFNRANLSEADFRGASEYFIDVRETMIKKAKFSLPEAMNLLSSLDIVLNDP